MAHLQQETRLANEWRSCRGSWVHGARSKPLLPVRRAASLGSAMEQSNSPFGGAIVTKLAGSAKLVKGEHHVVPLLGPGPGKGIELPFGASLDLVRRCKSEVVRASTAAATCTACNSSGTSMDDNASAASPRMLDVLYVLAGSGIVTSVDGTVRQLHAGDSLVTWHNTCEVHSVSPDDQPPAVLKFHFPASVLMLAPGAVAAPSPSHAELQVLVNECQGGSYDGELSPQEAANMLSGVQDRASRAISHLYGQPHEGELAEAEAAGHDQPPAAAVPAGAAPASSINNILPVGPFLRRLLQHATGPAVGGVRRLQSAWLRRGGSQPPGASAAAEAAASDGTGQLQARARCGGSPLEVEGRSSSGSQAASGCVLLQRALEEFKAFRFPRQTNRLAFVFDPAELGLSLSFGVEVFEPGHHTPLHIHKAAHELFFVLAGEGVAFCNGQRFTVRAGDCVVFPPRAVHGIDNTTGSRLYCLQLMTPNEAFVEHVQSGEPIGRLDDEDLCNLTSRHC